MKIGMLSFAHMHAGSYASCLQQLPDVKLAGIWDENQDRGIEMAKRFGSRYYADHETLLVEDDIAGVIVCAANVDHRWLTEAAAAAGKHVLCEKPLATSLEDAHAMIRACDEAGVILQTAFPVRFSPPVQEVQHMIAAGKIGPVLAAKTTNHGRMPGGWFIDPEKSGGGAVIDHTVHVVDLLRWILDQEVVEVYAEVGTLLHPGLPVDDAGLLHLRFESGFFATLDASWSRPSIFPTWGDVTMEIIGRDGVIHLDAFAQNVNLYSQVDQQVAWVNWGSNMDLGLVRSFVDAIAENKPPLITGYDGLKALEVALAAYRSAQTGQPVPLPLE
ncbi:MAG TPA: Gfo/Idh/MocA family oxidoreductase [Anaerolineae bacterium]|nr:Gfo/Idh/MocA family oxidoreductase [Anaerolineae bacterium]HIQ05281.1 Gfo/Idh/MocA family oxidoreductase [Anaerolineae bacterium]